MTGRAFRFNSSARIHKNSENPYIKSIHLKSKNLTIYPGPVGFPLQSLTQPSGGCAYGLKTSRWQKSPPLIILQSFNVEKSLQKKFITIFHSCKNNHSGLAWSFCHLPRPKPFVSQDCHIFCPSRLRHIAGLTFQ
jgi:hypothetical protein